MSEKFVESSHLHWATIPQDPLWGNVETQQTSNGVCVHELDRLWYNHYIGYQYVLEVKKSTGFGLPLKPGKEVILSDAICALTESARAKKTHKYDISAWVLFFSGITPLNEGQLLSF